MVKALLAGALLMCAAVTPAIAQTGGAQTSAQASSGGFMVVASIVTDADWREKWNTPPETAPKFHGPGKMKPGEKAWLLTFFSGARLKDGVAKLKCDVTITDPDGEVQRHPAQLCFEGRTPGAEGSLFLTGLEIGFEVSPKDLDGITTFEIGVTDMQRGLRVPVEVSVEFATGNRPK